MSVIRCESCLGRKTMMGMGGMKKDCPLCKGIGYIKTKEDKSQEKLEKVNVTRKKRGPNKVKVKDVINSD